ncbi:hypothetical protein LTS14_004847 [Recurvomyces mirabilis]|uniref:uncharacterized protein n=1 Tax=Recurvomyces mirabilis TaxID=574656 RepID=UPI002DDFCF07|nr:hypothetical protein LTS14_004847 [Recurvomyces mirabilis]
MPPIVHLVRHAEGHHNVAKNGEDIHDPFLTEKGEQQCRELCMQFPFHDDIDLLMASPMKRTIQTCQISFKPVVDRGHKILLMPLAQESSDAPMDTGSSTEELTKTFGDVIDTQRLELFPYWFSNHGRFDVDGESLIKRGAMLRKVLRDRPEKNIAIVSHGTFAHFIVGNVTTDGEQTTRMWANAECRSFKFVAEDDEDAQMTELEESRDKRPDLEIKNPGHLLRPGAGRKGSMGEAMTV